MSISVEPRKYWTKRDQFKTKEYVIVRYQDPSSWDFDDNENYKPKEERYSCGEVHDPNSWIRAEQKIREIYERKLQHALGQLKDKMSNYIDLETISSIKISVQEGDG